MNHCEEGVNHANPRNHCEEGVHHFEEGVHQWEEGLNHANLRSRSVASTSAWSASATLITSAPRSSSRLEGG